MCIKHNQFTVATATFKFQPSPSTFLGLQHAALALLTPDAKPVPYLPPLPVCEWVSVDDPNAFLGHFEEIRVILHRHLNSDEIGRVAGCIGYALRQELAGEEMTEPYVIQSVRAGQTILLFGYDSTKSRRDDPDFDRAFELAGRYIVEGSPLRKTDRAGAGTKGTRLVSGIGKCRVEFAVR